LLEWKSTWIRVNRTFLCRYPFWHMSSKESHLQMNMQFLQFHWKFITCSWMYRNLNVQEYCWILPMFHWNAHECYFSELVFAEIAISCVCVCMSIRPHLKICQILSIFCSPE
jgi:hypothetical protein